MRSFLLGALPRLVLVGLVLLAFQRTVLSEQRPFGVAIQLILALVAAGGAGAGPERGAICGFVLGAMYDLGVGTPLGLTALVYALAGYVAGYSLTLTPTPPWWLSSLFTAVGAAVGEIAVPIGKTLIGEEGWFNRRLFTVVPVVAVAALLLSPLLVPLGRWVMCFRRPKWKVMVE